MEKFRHIHAERLRTLAKGYGIQLDSRKGVSQLASLLSAKQTEIHRVLVMDGYLSDEHAPIFKRLELRLRQYSQVAA